VAGKATGDVEVGGQIETSLDRNPRNPKPRNPNQPWQRERERVRATVAAPVMVTARNNGG